MLNERGDRMYSFYCDVSVKRAKFCLPWLHCARAVVDARLLTSETKELTAHV